MSNICTQDNRQDIANPLQTNLAAKKIGDKKLAGTEKLAKQFLKNNHSLKT
jgi:hypothetical protein